MWINQKLCWNWLWITKILKSTTDVEYSKEIITNTQKKEKLNQKKKLPQSIP